MSAKHNFKKNPDLNLDKYNTDKISSNYLDKYEPILEHWVGKKINLLELGILKGGSLQLWHDYFPLGKIVGVDLKLPEEFKPTENIYMFKGSQEDVKFLSDVSEEIAPDGFDIIIDDASHIGELTKISFWHLFEKHLKPGGLYVIEDWGTGYWDDWSDGKSLDYNSYNKSSGILLKRFQKIYSRLQKYIPKSLLKKIVKPSVMPCHSYGMVGFIKQLIDEQAANDVTRKNLKSKSLRESKFKKIIVTSSIVFIFKADETNK
jgi:hypothetical protein